MQSIMECPVCSENFDRQVHCPLVLLCGHTLCKACASHLRAQKDGILCPLDRKIDKRQLEQISHSYHILELLEQISQMQTTIRYLKLSPSERMNALRDSATVRLNECRNNLERVQDKIQEANSKTESLTKRIGDFFTSIRTAIDVRQSELEEEVKKYSDDYIETYLEVEKEATICVDEAETKAKLVKDPSFTEMASEDLDVLELTPQRTLPEMPNEEFKMEFIGDLDSNLSYIKSLGRLEPTGWYHHAAINTTAVINAMIRRKIMAGSMQIEWYACTAGKNRSIANCQITANTARLITEGL